MNISEVITNTLALFGLMVAWHAIRCVADFMCTAGSIRLLTEAANEVLRQVYICDTCDNKTAVAAAEEIEKV